MNNSIDKEYLFKVISSELSDYAYSTVIDNDKEYPEWIFGGFEKITGYNPDKFISSGMVWSKLIHPYDIKRIKDFLYTSKPEHFSIEYRIITKSGQVKWIEDNAKLEVENGKIKRVIGGAKDITEIKIAKEELKNEKDFADKIIEKSGLIVVSVDTAARIINYNTVFAELSGYKLDEVVGKNWIEIFSSEDQKTEQRIMFKKILAGKKLENNTYPIVSKDGSIKYISWQRSFQKDESGNINSIIAIGKDITKSKELKERLNIKKYAIEQTNDAICITDRSWKIFFANNAFLKRWNIPRHEDITNRNFKDFWAIDEEFHQMSLAISSKNAWNGQMLARKSNNKEFQAEVHSTRIFDESNSPIYIVNSIQDITERIESQQELINSEKRFKQLSELMPEMVFELSPNGTITYFNQKCIEKTGYSRDQLENSFNIIKLIDNDYKEIAFENIRIAEKDAQTVKNDVRIRKADGSTFDVVCYNSPVINDGEFVGFRGLMIDISEKQRIIAELKESEESFRSLFEQSHDGIFIANPNGEVINWNNAMTKITGIDQRTALELRVWEIMEMISTQNIPKPNLTYKYKMHFDEFFRTGDSQKLDATIKNQIKNAYGNILEIDKSFFPINSKNGYQLCCIIKDITDIVRSHEEINKTLKEKDLLLKEVHHRVKNNLQIISSLLEMAGSSTKNPESQEVLINSLNRIRAISLIHDGMYQNEDISMVDFFDYILNIIQHLRTTYLFSESEIMIDVETNNIFLPIDKAIPCGLLVNEMLNNSILKAMNSNLTGRISILLARDSSGQYKFEFEDLINEKIIANEDSFEYQLLNLLTHQLGANQLRSKGNNKIKIVFSE